MFKVVPPRVIEDEFRILELQQVVVTDNTDQSSHIKWLFDLCSKVNYPSGTSSLVQAIVHIVCESDEVSSQSRLFDLLGDSEVALEILIQVMGRLDNLKKISAKTIAAYDRDQDRKAISLGFSQKAGVYNKASEPEDQKPANSMHWLLESGFSDAYLTQERLLGLQKNRVAALDTWKDDLNPEGTLVHHDKVGLPAGTERKTGVGYEEVFIPAPKRLPKAAVSELVAVSDLESWAQLAFENTKHLNRIQSIVYPVAYNSAENILVCAPTGAGKTNIAMLAFLQLVKQHIIDGELDRESVKAVYVAPMKALAQEVVTKFSERLKPLGFVVREFTGDMQLTRSEVESSNLIVTTPEKWYSGLYIIS
jgi:hypothetical protein